MGETVEDLKQQVENLKGINAALATVLTVICTDKAVDAKTQGYVLGLLKARGFAVQLQEEND